MANLDLSGGPSPRVPLTVVRESPGVSGDVSTMTDFEASRGISESTSSIVRIAYHQLSIMCGTYDTTAPTNANANDNANDMVCTRRLLDLPVFATITLAFSNAYAITKGSHGSITSLLNCVEDAMRASLKFASPVTDRIADVLETPLKTADNAVCVGLDFVEERIPSVKLPPGQIYVNVKDSVRNLFTTALETLRLLFGGSKMIEGSSIASETAQEEIRKVSS